MYLIKGSTRLGLQRVFSTKNLLIRHQPIYFKRKFHPRQDVYYILFAILFSNISKTYKSKTLIVNHFCPGRLYFFKNPSESHLLWTRLLLGTWEYMYSKNMANLEVYFDENFFVKHKSLIFKECDVLDHFLIDLK